ncbi:MAG TPA: ATP-binding protein [Actinocrinis sp.]|nr:ATP-binding protein [Actinocrinis sp.]
MTTTRSPQAAAPGGEDATLLTVIVATDRDVFAVRRQAKVCAAAAGLENRDQVRLATAVSELGRDLLRPAGLTARFVLRPGEHRTSLLTVFEWTGGRGPSAESLSAVSRLLPQVRQESRTAAVGPGEKSADSAADAGGVNGTAEHRDGGRIVIECALPPGRRSPADRAEDIRRAVRDEAGTGATMIDDLRAQTRDLLASLDESRAQSEELQRLNAELEQTNQGVVALYTELSQELEETNRGVVALYAELDEKSRLLREASESKTRFWSNISHELRTPINSVIGLSRILVDPGSEPLTEEQHRQVSLIGAAGNMLLMLVDELLDVAKAEAGRLVPQFTAVDLPALLAQVDGLMAGTAPVPGVALEVCDGSGLPYLETDEVMLTRILRNLLSNSLKFTREGEVRLDVRVEPDGWLRFVVSDTGVGIPQDQQTKVFEEFYQVPGPHQRNRSGTGLGLPYARRLSGLLGGSLTLESEPGRGTTVTVRLPPRPDAPAAPIRRLGTVLSADDDPVFAEVFLPVLEQLAERVVQVGSGGEVLPAVRATRPDAVLLDLHMPGLDGQAVLSALAADPQLRGIPVVVVTEASAAERAGAGLSHARGVVSKSRVTAERLAELLSASPGKEVVDEQH